MLWNMKWMLWKLLTVRFKEYFDILEITLICFLELLDEKINTCLYGKYEAGANTPHLPPVFMLS